MRAFCKGWDNRLVIIILISFFWILEFLIQESISCRIIDIMALRDLHEFLFLIPYGSCNKFRHCFCDPSVDINANSSTIIKVFSSFKEGLFAFTK